VRVSSCGDDDVESLWGLRGDVCVGVSEDEAGFGAGGGGGGDLR
jgi:hypothetical protein